MSEKKWMIEVGLPMGVEFLANDANQYYQPPSIRLEMVEGMLQVGAYLGLREHVNPDAVKVWRSRFPGLSLECWPKIATVKACVLELAKYARYKENIHPDVTLVQFVERLGLYSSLGGMKAVMFVISQPEVQEQLALLRAKKLTPVEMTVRDVLGGFLRDGMAFFTFDCPDDRDMEKSSFVKMVEQTLAELLSARPHQFMAAEIGETVGNNGFTSHEVLVFDTNKFEYSFVRYGSGFDGDQKVLVDKGFEQDMADRVGSWGGAYFLREKTAK